jgi:putative endonuclease
MRDHNYYVYLLASRRNGTLYCGVTNDLARRVKEHRQGTAEGFTSKYRVTRLVWFELHSDINEAILREKRIKKWNRDWKIALIEASNRDWGDLAVDLGLEPLYPDLFPKKESIVSNGHSWPPAG